MSLRHTEVTGALEPCGSQDHPDCGIRDVLERIGDKWTVLVIAELSPGPGRFRQLQRAVHGISQRMLTLTLRRLERDGLVSRTVVATIPPQVTYALTARGQSLTQVVQTLVTWAQAHHGPIQKSRRSWDEDGQRAPQ
ncbi:helix-turn-helix domain-containing protein [Deinococcus sp. QL22]|uniref:winged helix-turn-helix transcriptional regulator n=1 Tax=Deinococcus sp. QL22 TaxID=2939437 RepID=UPI00201708A8|nr:helix-turn-helix domain-containing protein [Deinococcus sp. QL22]UQN07981.1 helix-turn-helix transcriptional regulator [Deinococcus sp. QL22]